MASGKAIILILLMVTAGAAAFVVWYLPRTSGSKSASTISANLGKQSGCQPQSGDILVIADLNGFNNSVQHLQKFRSEPYPVIKVHQGQRVTILICNTDEYSPHGFAIVHYFDGGVALMPHQSFRLSFIANAAGTFNFYCNIFCPVHVFMLSGEFTVTA